MADADSILKITSLQGRLLSSTPEIQKETDMGQICNGGKFYGRKKDCYDTYSYTAHWRNRVALSDETR